MIEDLASSSICSAGGTQARVALSAATIEEFATDLRQGCVFPPIVVFFDRQTYWLADGFHRMAAYRFTEAPTIRADVRAGSRRDAILYAAGSNRAHGLRRTIADRRYAVLLLLSDDEWFDRSDHWVAETVGVDRATVADVRRMIVDGTLARLNRPHVDEPPPEDRPSRTGKDGKKYPKKRSQCQEVSSGEKEGEVDPLPPSMPPPALSSEAMVDENGCPVPSRLQNIFAARVHFDKAMLLLHQLDAALIDAADGNGGHYLREWLVEEDSDDLSCDALAEVAEILKRCRPANIVCQTCHNGQAQCPHCGGRYWDCQGDL